MFELNFGFAKEGKLKEKANVEDLNLLDEHMRSRGRRVIGISGSLIWSKTLVELIFNPCGEFR